MSTEKAKVKFDLPAIEITEQEAVKAGFIDTCMKMHGMKEIDAIGVYERELRYYKRAVNESEKLKQCTGISLVSAFLELSIQRLSLQPGQKADCYLEARSSKITVPEQKGDKIVNVDKWIQVCRIVVSAYGELNLRIQSGQIIRMNNPIVLYDGDHFQPKTTERGELTVEYWPAIPRKSNTIIGCWVSMVLPHNGIDFKWLLADDIERLKKFSVPKTRATADYTPQANALYTANDGQIDPGFLEAKTIKHAFRSKTKLKISDAIAFEDDPEEEQQQSFAETKQAETVNPIANPTPTSEDGDDNDNGGF